MKSRFNIVHLIMWIIGIPLFVIYLGLMITTLQTRQWVISGVENSSPTPKSFNLVEELDDLDLDVEGAESQPSSNCTIEFMNDNQLQQDHPCVIDVIQRLFLDQPAPPLAKYNLNYLDKANLAGIETKTILKRLLRNQTRGFFLETGVNDGEIASKTLHMERFLGWTGVLLESNPQSYQKLITRNRKAFTLPVCLSPEPYPISIFFNKLRPRQPPKDGDMYTAVQCFPLYSILLAVNQTRIDFLRISPADGFQFQALKTVPWDKVNVPVISVGFDPNLKEESNVTSLLKANGFIRLGRMTVNNNEDVVYVKRDRIMRKHNS